jgi:hypothetical protein
MKKITMTIVAISLCALLTACASDKVTKGQVDAKMPVNCASAEADIRVLKSEKVHASEQLAAGVGSIVPVGIFTNAVSGTTTTNIKVTTGEYNKMLDAKIAEIKKTCGVK